MIDNGCSDIVPSSSGIGHFNGLQPHELVKSTQSDANRAVHYVGFRDDRFWSACRIWGGPRFIHRWWDKRAQREIAPNDIVIFAEGDWRQEPRAFNAPDIIEPTCVRPSDAQGRSVPLPRGPAGTGVSL